MLGEPGQATPQRGGGGLPGSMLPLVAALLSALEQSLRWGLLPCGPTSRCFSPSRHTIAPGLKLVMGDQPVKDKVHPGDLTGEQVKRLMYKCKCGSTHLCFTHSFMVHFAHPATGQVEMNNERALQYSRQTTGLGPSPSPASRADFKPGSGLSFFKNFPDNHVEDGGGPSIERVKIRGRETFRNH